MKLVHTTTLSREQKEAVLELVDACKKAEPVTLSAALEDELDYFLSYGGDDDRVLLGYSFLFFTEPSDILPEDNGCAEFMAFVHPAHRRKGHFTGMLNAALSCTETYEKTHNCELDFYLLTDQKSEDAKAVLDLIGAEYWYSEYKMVRPLTEADRAYRPHLTIQRDGQAPEGADLYAAVLDGQVIGTCAVTGGSPDLYLYSFQIREDFQSQGHGNDFLLGMLALLAGAGTASVSVQVSGLNYIARNLYKKTGFRQTEALSYYIY